MSFVVAVMRPGYAVVAGDTQLNDDNGKRPETGIKVFPVFDENTVIGLVGDYRGHLKTIEQIKKASIDKKMEFDEKTKLISKLLSDNCNDYNGIMVCVQNNATRYSILSNREGWSREPISASDGEVKVLIPPDIKEEFCYPYINSMINIKSQVVNCVKAVGNSSSSVNDKVFGVELTNNGTNFFTDGILYNDITVRIV